MVRKQEESSDGEMSVYVYAVSRKTSSAGEISVTLTMFFRPVIGAAGIWTPICTVCKHISREKVYAEGKSVSRSTVSEVREFEIPIQLLDAELSSQHYHPAVLASRSYDGFSKQTTEGKQ